MSFHRLCPKTDLWFEFRAFTLIHLSEINELMEKYNNDIHILNFLKKIRESCLKNIEEQNNYRCYTCGVHFTNH